MYYDGSTYFYVKKNPKKATDVKVCAMAEARVEGA
jgi:hypothetical protein